MDKFTTNTYKEVEISHDDVLKEVEDVKALIALGNEKVSSFSSDEDDEFQITRRNDLSEGIFKVFANPTCILELENNRWGESKGVEEWEESVMESPAKLFSELEKWLGICSMQDRRLHQVFKNRELKEGSEGIVELILRLEVAFGFAAPFYQIEALVPLIQNGELEKDSAAGFLDTVAFLLPAALGPELVQAKKLDWEGLNWEKIKGSYDQLEDTDPRKAIILRIAVETGVAPHEVIFAANVLEWIPVEVGGKLDTFSYEEAIEQLHDLTSKPQEANSLIDVAQILNAKIRFMNWFPQSNVMNESNEDVFNGVGWRYSAVCDTATLLLEQVVVGNGLKHEFQSIFNEDLLPQLQNLDASSARGRFLMSLLNEGRFTGEVSRLVDLKRDGFIKEVVSQLLVLEQTEEVLSFEVPLPSTIIGGKAAGLRVAHEIFGKEFVLPRNVVTVEAIDKLFRMDPLLRDAIAQLDVIKNVELREELLMVINNSLDKIVIPERIIFKVLQGMSSDSQLAVRSNSADEDNQILGNAVGIYESITRVEQVDLGRAIKEVLKSFFSEGAVEYRDALGLSHKPQFAIIIEKYIEGEGGTILTDGQQGGVVSVSSSAEKVTASGDSVNIEFRKGGLNSVENIQLQSVVGMAQLAELMLGGPVDIEFVIDNEGQIHILQMRENQGIEGDIPPELKEFEELLSVSAVGIQDSPINIYEGQGILLEVGDAQLQAFSGTLLSWIFRNNKVIGKIQIKVTDGTPLAGHFINIMNSMPMLFGIAVEYI